MKWQILGQPLNSTQIFPCLLLLLLPKIEFVYPLAPCLCRNVVANFNEINLLDDGKSKNSTICTHDTVVFQYGIRYVHICNICVSIEAVGNFSVHELSLVCYLNQLNEERERERKMP